MTTEERFEGIESALADTGRRLDQLTITAASHDNALATLAQIANSQATAMQALAQRAERTDAPIAALGERIATLAAISERHEAEMQSLIGEWQACRRRRADWYFRYGKRPSTRRTVSGLTFVITSNMMRGRVGSPNPQELQMGLEGR